MSYNATVYRVFIASPSDVKEERQITREIIYEWNSVNSHSKQKCLLPISWEYDTSPEMGGSAQDIINKQILKNSDLLIGIFWTRIGTPTSNSASGSVEEIEKHISSGKPTMLYFSDEPVILQTIDQNQYSELKSFRKKCFEKGLVETFNSIEDFKSKLRRQLFLKLNDHDYFNKPDNTINQTNPEEDNLYESIALQLTKEEKEIIIEADKSSSGGIIKSSSKNGFYLNVNSKLLNLTTLPILDASWKAAIKSLVRKKIIERQKGTKGHYQLTLLGYKIADELL